MLFRSLFVPYGTPPPKPTQKQQIFLAMNQPLTTGETHSLESRKDHLNDQV